MSNALTTKTPLATRQFNLIDQWHRHLDVLVASEEVSSDTASAYKYSVKLFQDWWSVKGGSVQSLEENTVQSWVASMRGKGLSVSTRRVRLAGLRSLCSWLKLKGHIATDPTAGVKAGKQARVKRHKRPSLNLAESKKLLSLSSLTKRDRAMVWLFLFTAARSVELWRAKIEDLQEEDGELVLYVHGKGRTESEKEPLYLANPNAQKVLREYLAELKERGCFTGSLFVTEQKFDGKPRAISRRTLRHIMKSALRAAFGESTAVSTHGLRHTAALNALANGADLQDVQGMLRHSDINTTMIYVKETERRAKAAERKISYA